MKKFLFVLVVVGLVCVGCDSGSTGGGDKILGLPYSLKFDHKDNFGGELISYILDCSYDEAHKILTQKFGRDSGQVGGPQGDNKTFPANIAFWDYFVSNPNCVVLQDCVDFGAYRLWCDSSTYGGFEWEKPFERKGTLRITGIPAKHEGQIADFNMWYSLGMRGGEMAYDRIISSINKWSKPWEDNSYSVIKNGSVDIPLWWFPRGKNCIICEGQCQMKHYRGSMVTRALRGSIVTRAPFSISAAR